MNYPTLVRLASGLAAVFVVALIVAGCGSRTGDTPPAASVLPPVSSIPAADPSKDEHAHKPGAHGGVIISIGVDSYHAEAVVEKNGTLRLFLLGRDETRIQEIDAQTPTAYVKGAGETDAVAIELKPAPQVGDAENKTSQFVGELPQPLLGSPIDVTIPNLRIGDERFRVAFTTAHAAASHDEGMPPAIPKGEEETLYLTPGGKYTEADIKANGMTTAAKKFRGIPSRHNAKTQPGDRICPISLTKSSPKFTWIVDGKEYQFCCPPCVDEFVRLAKESPDNIKLPEDYVKE